MELNTGFVGTKLRSRSTIVNWRDTMNYAAAVGDNNPVYFDDTLEDGIIAPPMFCVSLTWPISERMGEHIESESFPEEVIPTQVHYTEHIQIHRLVKPEDRLTISGKIAEIQPHRAGTYVIIRFDAADHQGNPVFTEHIGGLMRGVRCIGDAVAQENVPEIPRHQADIGAMDWVQPLDIDPLLPYIYDGCTGIYFPIHTSIQFARSVGLPSIILQGTATLALAVREITNAFAGGDPTSIRVISCRFTGMVEPGTRISVKAKPSTENTSANSICFVVISENGNKAIRDGQVVLEKQTRSPYHERKQYEPPVSG
ncbi:MAG: MaoC/PaaZ C-terminal domain-containing protein [Desulfosalsimonas sp.]